METSNYFGEVVPSETWVIKYGEHRLVFEPLSAHRVVYKKFHRNALVREFLIAAGHDKISILPLPPIHGPLATDFLMLRLEPPIALGVEAKISIETRMPIAVGVFVGRKLLDIVQSSPVKYAVYGSPLEGLLCRYLSLKLEEQESELSGVVELRLVNNSGKPVKVNKIVAPIRGIHTYIDIEGRVYLSGIAMNIMDRRSAEVVTGLEPPNPSARPIPGKKPRITTFIMKYGY